MSDRLPLCFDRARRRAGRGLMFAFLALLSLLVGCSRDSSAPRRDQPDGPPVSAADSSAEQPAPPNSLELVFTYGSEKQKWIEEVTEAFNHGDHKLADGRAIFVRGYPMGSGELIDEVLSGRRHAHLTSPASGAFIALANAESRAKTGKDLVGNTQNLVLSPVVIAMWKPMAEALGWGKKSVGWTDILDLARNPMGWAAHGQPRWGTFKFGHTHPEYSNSGLISLFATVYAAAGKATNLKLDDVSDPKVAKYLHDIEAAVVHYGSSTGFFGAKMFAGGPQYLSAAVLYENMVIDSYGSDNHLPFPIVAIYPKEGTFWSDHPVAVVEREWVTPAHREAADLYMKFLLDRPQQERAMAFGFRPSDPQIALAAPLDAAHGIDPKEPKTTLPVPSVEVMDAIKKLWHQNKKHANIALVLDTSGSMKLEERMTNARIGAAHLISMLDDEDEVSFLPFNDVVRFDARKVSMKDGRQDLIKRINGLFADGGTSLYDAIDLAYKELLDNPSPDKISAIVVLTDGKDENSRLKYEELLARFDSERQPIRIFTIGYSADAEKTVLKGIADATQAKFYAGTPANILEVFKEISTFF